MNLNQRISDAAQYIKARITEAPSIGLILGSGLGDFADGLENRFREESTIMRAILSR